MNVASQNERYIRASMGLKAEIAGDLAADYHSDLLERVRANGNRLEIGGTTLLLAREFGFCYGVEKAVDLAYEARRKFPDRRLVLTTEIIHNPDVNRRLREMGIAFLSDPGSTVEVGESDVVILPAFGVAVEELERFRKTGAVIIDTTCGSVIHVWKRVEKYARDGFTSLIHGKYSHEETIATASQVRQQGGHYLIVRNMEQAESVCAFLAGARTAEELIAELGHGASPGFEPALHLERIGVANQTTMMASESLAIAKRIGEVLAARHGESNLAAHFRSFDTICSATQDRQDAVAEMMARERPDLMIIIGGYNSSNTNHLVLLSQQSCPTFHISRPEEIVSAEEIRHKPAGTTEVRNSHDWLPAKKEMTIGFTAGASTPNRAIGETMERVLELRRLESGPRREDE